MEAEEHGSESGGGDEEHGGGTEETKAAQRRNVGKEEMRRATWMRRAFFHVRCGGHWALVRERGRSGGGERAMRVRY